MDGPAICHGFMPIPNRRTHGHTNPIANDLVTDYGISAICFADHISTPDSFAHNTGAHDSYTNHQLGSNASTEPSQSGACAQARVYTHNPHAYAHAHARVSAFPNSPHLSRPLPRPCSDLQPSATTSS